MLKTIPKHLFIDGSQVSFDKEIGKGSFACVFKGKWLGTPVAIKRLNETEDLEAALMYEIEIMAMLRHPNVVQFMGR